MAICKTCGKKYSKWTTPVSTRGVCGECFKIELGDEGELTDEDDVTLREDVPASSGLMAQETISERRMVPIRLRSFLPRSRSKIVFALVMGCYGIACSMLMTSLTWAAVRVPRPPHVFPFYTSGGVSAALNSLVLAPLIESLMFVVVFEIVRRVRAPGWVQVVISALFFSGLHAWPWWPRAIIVLPSFFIQSGSYLYWRRLSWKDAYWVIVCIHAMNNAIPTLNEVGRLLRHA